MSFVLDERTHHGPAGVWLVVKVSGRVDVDTAPRLRERLVELHQPGWRCVLIDLRSVEWLDRTGLGVLVGGLKRARAVQGALQLVATQPAVVSILRVTGLTGILPLHGSVDATVAASACAQDERNVDDGR